MQWDPIIADLLKVVLLAFLIERALAVVFEWNVIEAYMERFDLKPVIAALLSIALCYALKLNAVGALGDENSPLQSKQYDWLGFVLTGLVVAGGSAGAVKLFQDVLGFR